MSTPLQRAMEVTGCDINLAKRLAGLFLPNCNNVDRTIRALFLKEEYDELASSVHKLKSGLAMFGTTEAATICENLETSARQRNAAAVEGLLSPFFETVEAVKTDLVSAMAAC